jgi:hypothetical protein
MEQLEQVFGLQGFVKKTEIETDTTDSAASAA